MDHLLHDDDCFYYFQKTELPIKVPITPHHLENRYYAPPPIAITGNHLTPFGLDVSLCAGLNPKNQSTF